MWDSIYYSYILSFQESEPHTNCINTWLIAWLCCLEATYENLYQASSTKVIVSEKFKVLCGIILFHLLTSKPINLSNEKRWAFVYSRFLISTYQHQYGVYICKILNFLLRLWMELLMANQLQGYEDGPGEEETA